MTSLVKYSPVPLNDCDRTYPDLNTFPGSFNIWDGIMLSDSSKDSTSKEYNEGVLKVAFLAGYFEAKGYSLNLADYTEKFPSSGTDLEFSNPTETKLVTDNTEVGKMFTITATYVTGGRTYAADINIIQEFDQNQWINMGQDYSGKLRGDVFLTSLATGPQTINNVLIAAGSACMPATSLLQTMGKTSTSLILLNPLSVYMTTVPSAAYYKKCIIYKCTDLHYYIPSTVKRLTPGSASTDYSMTEWNMFKASTTYYIKSFELSKDYVTNNIANCYAKFNSFYTIIDAIDKDEFLDNCFQNLDIMGYAPTDITITDNIDNFSTLRWLYFAKKLNLDIPITNVSISSAEYAAGSYDLTAYLSTGTGGDQILYVSVVDAFIEENPVTNLELFDNISYTYNGVAVNYDILTEKNYSWTSVIQSLLEGLNLSATTFAGKVVLYAFGHVVHSFVRDFLPLIPAVTPANVKMLAEAVPAITRNGWTGFSQFTEGNVKIYNIWQDKIINNLTPVNGILEPMLVTDLLDSVLSTVMYDNIDCIHSAYAYQIIIGDSV